MRKVAILTYDKTLARPDLFNKNSKKAKNKAHTESFRLSLHLPRYGPVRQLGMGIARPNASLQSGLIAAALFTAGRCLPGSDECRNSN